MITFYPRTPTMPARIAALRDEALIVHADYMEHSDTCEAGFPFCGECRRLMGIADRAGDRWALASGRWP